MRKRIREENRGRGVSYIQFAESGRPFAGGRRRRRMSSGGGFLPADRERLTLQGGGAKWSRERGRGEREGERG